MWLSVYVAERVIRHVAEIQEGKLRGLTQLN